MKVTHLRKKDVIKSSVKGIDIEFDHERLATILGVHCENGMREYIEEVWEESKYTKPLEITRRVANDETITAARRVKSRGNEALSKIHPFPCYEECNSKIWKERHFKLHGSDIYGSSNDKEAFGVPLVIKKGEEPKKYDFFEDTFLTMCKLTREDGVWWIGSGENRRRDDAPEEEEEEEEERNKDDFDWEAVIDEATVEEESGSDDQFYDAQVGEEEPMMKLQRALAIRSFIFDSTRKIKNLQSRPLGSY
ncbi:hypothetical protein Dimus_013688 [Dionaea muscipula]